MLRRTRHRVYEATWIKSGINHHKGQRSGDAWGSEEGCEEGSVSGDAPNLKCEAKLRINRNVYINYR